MSTQLPRNSTKREPSSVLNQLRLECANCKREAISEADKCTFKLCSGCYMVHYCNRECQLADRKTHKASCKAIKTDHLSATQTMLRDCSSDLLNYCHIGDLEGIKRDIARGVDFNVLSNVELWCALSFLISRHSYECVELLLHHHANPNVQDV